MKKLMIALSAIIAIVTSSSALSVSWGTSGTGVMFSTGVAPDPIVALPSGYDVLLVWDSANDGFDGYNNGFQDDDVLLQVGQIGATAGRTGGITYTYTGGTLLVTPKEGDLDIALPNAGSAKLYMVAFNALDYTTATMYGVSDGKLVTTQGYGANPPGTVPTYLLTSAGTDKITGTDYNPVPEPTSLALLAIGAAAIGLRRKFRK